MVRRDDQRRAALVDAAIEVPAREGGRTGPDVSGRGRRGLGPRRHGINYFASRDDLFTQAGARVYERLQPDEATIARQRAAGRGREAYVRLMRDLVGRVGSFLTGYLALLELRLEATRRPEPRTVLTERVRADVDANVAHHEASGLPRRRHGRQAAPADAELAHRRAAHPAGRLHRGGA
ncbi:hypothetical protein GCM10010234_17280 [Streptomyces hawaiiensis]